MATRNQPSPSTLSWPRIVALSSTLVLHAAAVAVVAIPIVAPLTRSLPQVVPTVVFEARPRPVALPEPSPPVPLPHTPRPRTPAIVPPTTSAPQLPTTNTVAVDSPMATPAGTDVAVPGPVTGSSNAVAGETRTLAYDGALRLRYPPMSVRQREQGSVLLRVLVDAGGSVQRIEIEHSSGHSQLDAAARAAVQQAHFRPVLRDGHAVPAWGIVPIEFRLDRA